MAGMFPLYLEKIAANRGRYVQLAPQVRHNPAQQQGLRVSEEMVQQSVRFSTGSWW